MRVHLLAYHVAVRKRSRLSLLGTFAWALLVVIVGAALQPGWLGQIGLGVLAILGFFVLWNLDDLRVAWREDMEAKRNR